MVRVKAGLLTASFYNQDSLLSCSLKNRTYRPIFGLKKKIVLKKNYFTRPGGSLSAETRCICSSYGGSWCALCLGSSCSFCLPRVLLIPEGPAPPATAQNPSPHSHHQHSLLFSRSTILFLLPQRLQHALCLLCFVSKSQFPSRSLVIFFTAHHNIRCQINVS